MADRNADAAKNGKDQQDVEKFDPGSSDRIEAFHRAEREWRVQHICVGLIPDPAAVRADQRNGHALERLRPLAMTGVAVAYCFPFIGKSMRLRARDNI